MSRTSRMAESASAAKPPDSALSDEQLGTIAVRLALYPQRSVERRVEGITFIDDTTIRQRVSHHDAAPGPLLSPTAPNRRTDSDFLFL